MILQHYRLTSYFGTVTLKALFLSATGLEVSEPAFEETNGPENMLESSLKLKFSVDALGGYLPSGYPTAKINGNEGL